MQKNTRDKNEVRYKKIKVYNTHTLKRDKDSKTNGGSEGGRQREKRSTHRRERQLEKEREKDRTVFHPSYQVNAYIKF